MSSASSVAEHCAQIGVAALAYGAGVANSLTTIPVSFAALIAIGKAAQIDGRKKCLEATYKAAIRSLEDSGEFSQECLIRASFLLQSCTSEISIDVEMIRKGCEAGADGFDRCLTEQLMRGIPFEPDDDAPRSAIAMALATAVATCRTHPDVHRDLTQNLLIDVARNQGVQLAATRSTENKVDTVIQMLHDMQRSRVTFFDNLLDFVFRENNETLWVELAVRIKEDGSALVALFHNLPFKDLHELQFFVRDCRVVFVTPERKIRDMGVTASESFVNELSSVNRVLFVLIDPNTGAAKEGYYIPFRVFDA